MYQAQGLLGGADGIQESTWEEGRFIMRMPSNVGSEYHCVCPLRTPHVTEEETEASEGKWCSQDHQRLLGELSCSLGPWHFPCQGVWTPAALVRPKLSSGLQGLL
jgi:hypothetical protein